MIKDEIKIDKSIHSIMIISDTQEPCAHPDAIDFCYAVKERYKPQLVVQIGDYCDFGALSNFDLDPDYLSANDELEKVIDKTFEWGNLFPNMYITMGNHEMRLYRKALKAGLPRQVLKDFNEIICAPKGWKFVEKLKVNWDDIRRRILFVHTGAGANSKDALAPSQHANVVHGHLHANFWIKWNSTTDAAHWDMNVGCLINDNSVVFKYNKQQTKRPIYGCGVIVNNLPILVPMILDNHGRWIGKLN